VAGAVLHLAGAPDAGRAVWTALTAVSLVPLSVGVARALAHGRVGVDVIALMAMAGALALGEAFAGAVIALMLSGGNALEAAAAGRARRELTALLRRAPHIAHRLRDGRIEEVEVDAVLPGDVLVVRAGEVLPVDGLVRTRTALLDESTLTGEPLPVSRGPGEAVRSGAANAGDAFELQATRPAAESSYAAIVRLVRGAEDERAPFVRLADRYAAIFLPFTVALAAVAWIAGGEPVRALAVLVVATPCPLILAAPIALISGVSRAARAGVIVKGGTAIEGLGAARTVLLDKTGTLTTGTPEVERIESAEGIAPAELLRLAASLEQASAHVTAEAMVHAAQSRGLTLSPPRAVHEDPGRGIEGTVENHRVAAAAGAGPGAVAVTVDGRQAGVIHLADRRRPGAAGMLRALREAGVQRIAMVTGDRASTAHEVARELGIDEVFAEQEPEGKLDVVRAMRERPDARSVVMVGDGVNDAPALALADVGVALSGEGAGVAAETADAVIVGSDVARLADAIVIGRRALAIARQSVVAGMGLSVAAMLVAATGALPPAAGALVQEAIDVAVILNALRALGAGNHGLRSGRAPMPAVTEAPTLPA
jgi:heavy metal translocating P-type ATPase